MDTWYILIPFLGGWTSRNPSYFDVMCTRETWPTAIARCHRWKPKHWASQGAIKISGTFGTWRLSIVTRGICRIPSSWMKFISWKIPKHPKTISWMIWEQALNFRKPPNPRDGYSEYVISDLSMAQIFFCPQIHGKKNMDTSAGFAQKWWTFPQHLKFWRF